MRVIHSGVGNISESDVALASVDRSIIIGFNVRTPPSLLEEAKRKKISIRTFRVCCSSLFLLHSPVHEEDKEEEEEADWALGELHPCHSSCRSSTS